MLSVFGVVKKSINYKSKIIYCLSNTFFMSCLCLNEKDSTRAKNLIIINSVKAFVHKQEFASFSKQIIIHLQQIYSN